MKKECERKEIGFDEVMRGEEKTGNGKITVQVEQK